MKAIIQGIVLGWGLFMVPAAGLSQEAAAEVRLEQPVVVETPKETAESLMFQAKLLTRLFGVPVTVDGAIPMAVRADQPWQLLNPLAPVEYGNGYDNVTLDPKDRGATGFKLFSVGF